MRKILSRQSVYDPELLSGECTPIVHRHQLSHTGTLVINWHIGTQQHEFVMLSLCEDYRERSADLQSFAVFFWTFNTDQCSLSRFLLRSLFRHFPSAASVIKQRQAASWVHSLPTALARFHSLQVASVSFAIGGFGFILGGFGFIRIIIRCHLVIHLLPRVSHATEREPRCPQPP